MSGPREGSRETGDGIIVSEAMDWCDSPTEPVPYRIWARQIDAASLADSVRQTDHRTHVRGSLVLRCYGDEPGVGGGVVSGTTGAECTPKTWSETVRAQGRNVVRHDDEWWMNHGNTYGRLYYTKDRASYSEPATRSVQSMMLQPSVGDSTEQDAARAQPAVSTDDDEALLYKASSVQTAPGLPSFPFGPQQFQQGRDATEAAIHLFQNALPTKNDPLYNLRKNENKGNAVRNMRKGNVRVSSGPLPGQICPEDRRQELQKLVKIAQDNVYTLQDFQGWNPKKLARVSCAEITERIRTMKDVLNARQKIQDECFAGTDKDHQRSIDETKGGINKLEALYEDRCGPSVVPGL